MHAKMRTSYIQDVFDVDVIAVMEKKTKRDDDEEARKDWWNLDGTRKYCVINKFAIVNAQIDVFIETHVCQQNITDIRRPCDQNIVLRHS